MPLKLRTAAVEDIPALTQMRWDDAFEGESPGILSFDAFAVKFTEFAHAAITGDRWSIWVAEVDDRLVANAFVEIVDMAPRPGRPHRKWGYVAGVYTVPSERNKGIGGELMRSVIECAKAEKFESLLLWSAEKSITLYQRSGFTHNPAIMELFL